MEIDLPLIGSLPVWKLVVGLIALYFGWDHIPAIAAAVKQLVAKGLNAKQAPVDSVVLPVVEDGAEEMLAALQRMSYWTLKQGSAEMLTRTTALYHELWQHLRGNP